MVRCISNFIKIIIGLMITTSVYAWEPTKPINVFIGFAPGSGNELSFRGISSIVEKNNPNVKFIIQNRPGAGGVIAMNEFVKKSNDGYNLYVPSNQGIFVTAEFFQKEAVKYTLNDFDYLIGLAKSPLVVIASHKSDVNTVSEFINKLKTTAVSMAASGGAHKLAYDYIAERLKLNRSMVTLIDYKGPAQAAQDIAGGHVEFGIIPIAVAATLIQSEKIKIIGICSEKPIKGFENYPLMNKFVPGMNVYGGWGIILPKNTTDEVKQWYVREFSKAIRSKEANDFFEKNYMFYDEKELTPKGFEQSMIELRNQWIPILQSVTKNKM